jgi:hypothetical protein
MEKKHGFRVPPSRNRRLCNSKVVEDRHKNSNIRGILLSLRYLSREAEGAGLVDLARTLEEAELQFGRYMENTKDSERA